MFQLHIGVQKCAKSCLKMSKNGNLGFFLEEGRGKWAGVAENIPVNPHGMLGHDKTFIY